MPVGLYQVTVEAQGFTKLVQENVKVDVGNTLSLALRLSVNQIAQTIDVSDTVYQTLNKDSANVETLVSGTQVTEISLNGRNWTQLLNLAPGTSALNNDAQQGTNVRIDDTAINGLRRRTSPTLDGISNVDHGSVASLVNNISVDAIQESRLVSSPYSAEFGAQAGPAINVATKRGTSEFHGSAFEFFRHDKLNAYPWESKQVTTGTPQKAHLRFNNFGGFVGGPIYQRKLFFFNGLEWKSPRNGTSVNELLPTEAMRRGDFSSFLPTGLPANYTCSTSIPDPNGVNQGRFILCDKSASTNGTPFPNNIIPLAKNEAMFSWQRNDQSVNYQDEAQIARSTYGLNFTEIFSANRLNKIPEVSVQGFSTISGNGLPYTIDARSWELRDNVTWVRGDHTLKFGVLYVNSNKAENTRVRDGGTITFSTGSTAGTVFRPQDSGNAFANMLLGAYTRYTETSNTTNAPTSYNQFEVYANDQWRVNNRLSLTLGLRMQYLPWPSTELGNIVGFDPSRFDPAKAPLGSNISSGSVDKGERVERGQRLAISTDPPKAAQFIVELKP